MTTDYAAIEQENVRRYGTDFGEIGELFFSQLYRERTHFIYELLQNAEDALQRRAVASPNEQFPRSVAFRLFKDRFELRHYGIPFSERDVRGICGILRGTKAGDLTQIGKFGIGFKSVYIYTATPAIHSGDEHFRIRDFVRPQAIPLKELGAGETFFVFPFDRCDVSRETAFQEIATRLETLSLRTLLFLRQIDRVDWEVEGGKPGAFLRKSQSAPQSARKVILSGTRGGCEGPEEWLVFQRSVRADVGLELPVEIAFLTKRGQGTPGESVVPVSESSLVVFFPTDKETHVGFLVQGPYRTTLSRDNVPSDDPWNSRLVSETANLLAESLPILRDMDFMNLDLLRALPTRGEAFPESFLFRPLFDKVRSAFRETDLLPAVDGSSCPASVLKLARPGGLRDLLSSQQLTKLYGAENPLEWLHEELSSDRNQSVYGYLTNDLEIEVVTPSDVAQLLGQDFLEAQSEEWMIRFYSFLQDQEALWREGTQWKDPGSLRKKPIIRLEGGSHVAPFVGGELPQAYLPGEHVSHFPTVKRSIAENKDALKFLSRLGLRKPDTAAEVLEYVLPRYHQSTAWSPNDQSLQGDLKLIVEAWRTDSSKTKEKLRERLRHSHIVPCHNPSTGETMLALPREAYFNTDELTSYFMGSESVRFVDRILPSELQKEFDTLLVVLGVISEPRRIEVEPDLSWEERTELRGRTGITSWRGEEVKDFDLDGLELFLDKLPTLGNEQISAQSLILWRFLGAHQGEHSWFHGRYSWFHYNPWSADFPARFLKRLRERPWLPGQGGELRRPADMFLNDLPEEFERSRQLADYLAMKSEQLAEMAAQLGVDEEALFLLREHAEEWKQFVKQHQLAKETAKGREPAVMSPNGTGDELAAMDHFSSVEEPAGRVEDETGVQSDSSDLSEPGKRLPVIVATRDASSSEHSPGAGPNMEAARAGVRKVLQYEIEHGREPQEMPHSNEGFDIRSFDPVNKVTRFIEVKSSSEEWGEANVALSAPQLRFGMKAEPGHEYWLYVVERACGEDFRIHCILDPARRATHFIYPRGWSRLAVDDSGESDS